MKHYENLAKNWREAHLLGSIGGVLSWDQQTGMPPLAAAFRGEQMGYVAQLAHHTLTSESYQKDLEQAREETEKLPPRDHRRRNVERAQRSLLREKQLPPALVNDLTSAATTGQTAWEEAKRRRDFALFEAPLQRILDLSREKARVLGFEKNPYDGLLPDFEWGVDSAQLDLLFRPLQTALTQLLNRANSSRSQPFASMGKSFDPKKQEELGQLLARELGFHFDDGVLLTSVHPFSTTLGPRDFRITTRYVADDFLSSYSAVAHEVGHSLYERGLPKEWDGQPAGQAASAGIHESQSLFWEKRVAQSQAFLGQWLAKFQAAFPGQLDELEGNDLFRLANRVKSSLIRVDADEVTYCLHIIIRYELEKALINDGLKVSEIPELWNQKYRHYLGIEPKHAGEGCLQDVHWSCGAFGYFPSYALGHLFSAQMSEAMEADLGPLDAVIEAKNLAGIRQWLGAKVHSRGALYDSMDLIQDVTGRPLSIEPFVAYLNRKLEQVYS